ncbi:hydroxyacylglutathione hydrolase [Powellomyces hirtus]|uniref:hydroxyacylglutathione hydrolase n=1 Tax=Powellomyces hirtus TaxID=109895 RepID=A0A507EB42_9FUNG|nr:hydroxyacylglutathione hydrolase [Powellomyces hirtus]
MRVTPIPCLSDNYAYLVSDNSSTGFVVDPVEPHKVLPVIAKENVDIKGLLTTHHHADHAGGNSRFISTYASVPVYGGDARIPALTTQVRDGATFTIGALTITPLYTVCHTRGSVSYYVVDGETRERAVFTGDTLFVAGCGRFFEGTPEQMYNSLHNVLGKLPDDTAVYCGHEYTKSNLKFAAHVEPSNPAIHSKLDWCTSHPCTVPSTIGAEKQFNPFMRCDSAEIRKKVGSSPDADPVKVMV